MVTSQIRIQTLCASQGCELDAIVSLCDGRQRSPRRYYVTSGGREGGQVEYSAQLSTSSRR